MIHKDIIPLDDEKILDMFERLNLFNQQIKSVYLTEEVENPNFGFFLYSTGFEFHGNEKIPEVDFSLQQYYFDDKEKFFELLRGRYISKSEFKFFPFCVEKLTHVKKINPTGNSHLQFSAPTGLIKILHKELGEWLLKREK